MGFLDGKVALVTGGGSGIGRGVVDLFVQEGAKVGVLEISPQKVEALRSQYSSDSVVVTQGDATSEDDNVRAVADVVGAFGRLTTLICVVGTFDFFTELPALPDLPSGRLSEAFDQLFGVNVKGTLLSVKAASEQLIEHCGDVVLTISYAGFFPGGGGPLYTASKFGVRGLVSELAYELAPKVRVNGVAPGGTITELNGIPALANDGQRLSEVPDIELIMANNPLGIAARPEDHSWVYAFLASRERAPGVTGTIIQSDGGLSIRGMVKMAGLG